MKLITVLLILLSSIAANAEPITLQWDASDTPGVTYTVFAYRGTPTTTSDTVMKFSNIVVDAGTNLTAVVNCEKVGVWMFVATAKLDGLESESSNMVSTMISLNKPKNIRRKLLF